MVIDKFNMLFEKYGYVIMLCILCIGSLIFFIYKSSVSLNFDELSSISNTNKNLSLLAVIYKSSLNDTWPPIYNILLHYIQVLFGNNELFCRLISILSNIISIPILYFLVKKIYSKKEAILTCILFSFSPFIHNYAIIARGYSLFLLLSICSFYLFVKFLEDNKESNLLLYFAITFVCSMTHYFGIYLMMFQLMFLAINKKNYLNKFYKQIILFLIITFLYPVFHYNSVENVFVFKNLYMFTHNSAFNDNFNRNIFIIKEFIPQITFYESLVEQILIYLLLLYFIINLKDKRNQFILFFAVLPILLLNIEAYIFKSFLEVRYFIFVIPLIYIMLSHTIKNVCPNKFFNLLLIFILIMFSLNLKMDKYDEYNGDREQLIFVKNKIENIENTIFIHEDNYHIEYYLGKLNLKDIAIPIQWNPNITKIKNILDEYKFVYIMYEFEASALKYKEKLEKEFNLIKETKQIYQIKSKE